MTSYPDLVFARSLDTGNEIPCRKKTGSSSMWRVCNSSNTTFTVLKRPRKLCNFVIWRLFSSKLMPCFWKFRHSWCLWFKTNVPLHYIQHVRFVPQHESLSHWLIRGNRIWFSVSDQLLHQQIRLHSKRKKFHELETLSAFNQIQKGWGDTTSTK